MYFALIENNAKIVKKQTLATLATRASRTDPDQDL
jgi:hypothetical protein